MKKAKQPPHPNLNIRDADGQLRRNLAEIAAAMGSTDYAAAMRYAAARVAAELRRAAEQMQQNESAP